MNRRSVDAYADDVVRHLITKVGSREKALRLLEAEEKLVRQCHRASVHPLAAAGAVAIRHQTSRSGKRKDDRPGFL